MNTEVKNGQRVKKIILFLLPLPLIIGTIGYYWSGMTLWDSLYFALKLYGLEWESDVKNSYVEVAKWMAPFLTAAGLATIIKNVFLFLRRRMVILFYKNATAVYSNSSRGELVCNNMEGGILCTEKPLKRVKNHIILFDSDEENMLFYQKHKEYFQDNKHKKTVYLCLNEVNSGLLKEDMDNVRIFNANDIIARDLWKRIKMWNCSNKQENQKVAILGFDGLGQRILWFGLQLNLYGKDQCVEYHVFGNSELYEATQRHFQTMNRDLIYYHGTDCEKKWDILRDVDYVIVAQQAGVELLQSLYLSCEKAKIHYYSPKDEKMTAYMNVGRLFPFGEDNYIFSNENIRTDKLYERAKKMNYDYLLSLGGDCSLDSEEEWRKLDGFTKGSNISACDYREVVWELNAYNKEHNIEMDLEEYAYLEHLRWSRYHLLNGWKYGVPANGKNKDKTQKIHVCLKAYEDLSWEDQEKDRQNIRDILEVK